MPATSRADAPLRDLFDLLPRLHDRIAQLAHHDVGTLRTATANLREGDAVDACALAAVACRRLLGVVLHDPQLVASLALARGRTVQMRTGEGKTLAAIAPALLFARVHGTVHVVTANQYLAERDSQWSGGVLRALGLDVAATLPGQSRATTRAAYQADVVYGAGSDFGFDFLRDRLVLPGDDPVQRGRRAAVVDEVDAVLIDGARTPLVLSGSAVVDEEAVRLADDVVRFITHEHPRAVDVDITLGRIEITDTGIEIAESLLGVDNLFGATERSDWPHLVRNALRAHVLLRRDRDYVVQDLTSAIAVVDELTGRILPGRRWSDGLHQAVESKERLPLTTDRRSLGRITVGTYFAGYSVVVGMSGTLEGAEDELFDVYGIRSVAVPTHRPIERIDHADLEVEGEETKFEAVADDTAARHGSGQPVLVGTVSIAQAARMSQLLVDRGVPHEVLTARNDAEEASIIAEAGQPGAVTVATQMAGRGVDIALGGDQGLMVWGLEHHGTARLDLQLRGRAGRQGDPGESRFAVSADEALLELAADVAGAQLHVERMEFDTRRDGRWLDGPIDSVHDLLHEWRLQAADPDMCTGLLEAAVRRMADRPLPVILDDPVLSAGLPGTQGRRARELARRIAAAFDHRRAAVGDTNTWAAIASAVLADLLLTVWADTLDQLDTDKHLARMGHLSGGGPDAWRAHVEARYRAFRMQVQRAWVLQLLAAKIVTTRGGVDQPVTTTVPTRPVPTACDPAADTEVAGDHEWTGPSLNRFWRRHFSVVPNPPLVLELDAIGDAAESTIRVHLDHDDPTRSRILLPALMLGRRR